MATGNMPRGTQNRPGLRKAGMLIGVVLALVALWFVWNFNHYRSRAELAAAYGARVGCACRYVENRTMQSCTADISGASRFVSASDDPDEKTVHARVLPLASATARYRPGFGCLLDTAD